MRSSWKHAAIAGTVAAALAAFALDATGDDDGVTVKKDLSYYDGKDRDEKKNNLDLYVPKGDGPFPVLAWVHGGAWKMGDKALFRHVGHAFAKEGILTAIVGYRLSPGVKHPEHVRDVARALAWLKKHAKEHQGDQDALFVSGQSSGGHLSALVALDPTYLKEQGLELSAIRGAIPMSGPFGQLALAAFPDAFPAETREDAAPLNHVGKDKPPFFVTWGDDDPPNLRIGGKVLTAKLEEAGVKAKSLEVKDRGHITIVTKIGSEKDELTEAVVKFVKDTAAEKPKAEKTETGEKKKD
ncbi:alpha/beta hydrolase [bacterium]|nr:alpha/beta hydrolase [bacterium]